MKILFIYPDMVSPDPTWSGYYYEGIATLSAAAKAAGHDCELLHVHHELPEEDIVSWIRVNQAENGQTLLAFSATTNQYSHVRKWAPALKAIFGFPTLVGGMHPTLSADDAISTPGIDMICKGDGELPLAALASALDGGRTPEGVPGIWWRNGEAAVRKGPPAPLTNLNEQPLPDWEIYHHFSRLMVIREQVGILMGSRGCPYDCAYCCNVALIEASKDQGKFVRFKDVPRFIAEIKAYQQRFPQVQAFFFEDDIFGVSKRWLKEFAPLYKREIGKPFGCNMRPNLVDDWMVDTLTAAGCVRIHMAIEAGNEGVRNAILNRRLSNEKLVESFLKFKRKGIQVMSYNIVGSPHETPSQVLETIKLNAVIDPEFIQHSIFYPYEGTPLYDLVTKEDLWAKDRVVTDYFVDTALEQASISRAQVLMFQAHFKVLVKHYQRIEKLPAPVRKVARTATDGFLVWCGAPKLLPMLARLATRRDRRDKRDQAAAAMEVAC
ncbi:MAG: radical SAM protein [Planctomycetota bacterium]